MPESASVIQPRSPAKAGDDEPGSPERRYARGDSVGGTGLSSPRNYYLSGAAEADAIFRERRTSSFIIRSARPDPRDPSNISVDDTAGSLVESPVVLSMGTRRLDINQRWRFKQIALAVLNSVAIQVLSILCVLLTLFLADSVLATTSSNEFQGAVDGVMTAVFVYFVLEFVLSVSLDPSYRFSLRFFTDLVGTISVTFDVSFLLGQYTDNQTDPADSAEPVFHAVRTARVARLARLANLARVVRLIAKTDRLLVDRDRRIPAPNVIAKNVAEAICHQAAVFIIIMSVLVVPQLFSSSEPTDVMAYLESLNACLPEGCLTAERAQDFCSYFAVTSTEAISIETATFFHVCQPAVAVLYPPRDLYTTNVGKITASFNIYRTNRRIALQNMYIVLCIIGCLAFLSASVLYVSNTQVVAPLRRLIGVIQENASAVLGALRLDDADADGAKADSNGGGNTMLKLEETIAKLSKLAAHVTNVGDKGSNLLKEYMSNDTLDLETRHWIMGQLGSVEPYDKRTSSTRGPGPQIPEGRFARKSSYNASALLLGPAFYDSAQRDTPAASPDEASAAVDALLDTWHLDVFECTPEELKAAAFVIFERLGVIQNRFCSAACARNFIAKVAGLYRDNPYHNFRHAFDVLHTLYRLVQLTDRRRLFSPIEKFSLAVAAIGHDIDHPGLTSNFLITTRDPLAMIYNDTSVLENHHTSTLYGLLASTPEADVLGTLDDGTWRVVRKIINGAIQHTDMTYHFKMVSQAEVFLELHAQSISHAHSGDAEANKRAFANPEDRAFIMNLLLHSADISNPAKPFAVYDKWTSCVLEEFFAQGDLEKDMGLAVSPGFDRVTTSRAGSQINFIEFVLTPMFATVVKIFPELIQLMQNLVDNRQKYAGLFDAEMDAAPDKTEAEKQEEKLKMAKRMAAFMARFEPVLTAVKSEMPAGPHERGRPEDGAAAAGQGPGGNHGARGGAAQHTRSGKRRENTSRELPTTARGLNGGSEGAGPAVQGGTNSGAEPGDGRSGLGGGSPQPGGGLAGSPEGASSSRRATPVVGSVVRRVSALGATVIPPPFAGAGLLQSPAPVRLGREASRAGGGGSDVRASLDEGAPPSVSEESTSKEQSGGMHSVRRSASGKLVRPTKTNLAQQAHQVESVRGLKMGQFAPGQSHQQTLPPGGQEGDGGARRQSLS